ncbi:MAG: response regulator [Planctomycetes bacterium]|nr:response regulator [Planctomycetota bacterium]
MITGASARKARLFVVEDEALIAEELRQRLHRLEYEVIGICDSGDAAIQEVAGTRPDLVLMDIRLKGALDGIETARTICDQLDIPVVYLTAHSDQATIERAKHTKPLGYILKPFHERDLVVTIEIALHRDRLDRKLRQSERRFAATLASIGDGVIATDEQGRVTFLNPVGEVLTGWKQVQAVGRPVNEVLTLVDERTGDEIESPLLRAVRTGEALTLGKEVLLRTRDGESVPIDDSVAPISLADRELVGAVMAFRDIRERREAQKVLEETRELLYQSQKLELIGRFSTSIAHDFNNFLSIIRGCGSLLARIEGLPGEARSLLAEIQDAERRAGDLADRLLQFGRKRTLPSEGIEPIAVVESVEPLLRRLLGKGIKFDLHIARRSGRIPCDASTLEQVILNLVVNARDAMPHGGHLRLETSWHPGRDGEAGVEGRPHLRLLVEDDGNGMDEATLRRVFEPYFTTKQGDAGTGLGLATVHAIVIQCGGTIAVSSELGIGTRFVIRLPTLITKDVRSLKVPAVVGGEALVRVLVVEDDQALLRMMSRALSLEGMKVHTATSVAQAIERHAECGHEVDVLVTDLHLLDGDGLSCVDILRRQQPGLAALVTSGSDVLTAELAAHHLDLQFLQKPFALEELVACLRRLVG